MGGKDGVSCQVGGEFSFKDTPSSWELLAAAGAAGSCSQLPSEVLACIWPAGMCLRELFAPAQEWDHGACNTLGFPGGEAESCRAACWPIQCVHGKQKPKNPRGIYSGNQSPKGIKMLILHLVRLPMTVYLLCTF